MEETEMKKVKITVFGTSATDDFACGCGCCRPSKTMKEEAGDLKRALLDKYGETIEYEYIDAQSKEMKGYPQVVTLLDRVRLPLICINDEPSVHGGLSQEMICGAIEKLVA
jgi:disulfide oxidoreductase YuzD